MIERREPDRDDLEPDAMAQMLQAAGARVPVSPVRAARVRAAVRASWVRRRDRQAVRRRAMVGGLLGAAAALLIAVTPFPIGERTAAPMTVAHIARIDGGGLSLRPGDTVRTGDWIATGAATRAALLFVDGTSVRLDEASRVRVRSAQDVELASGALYVDTGDTGGQFLVHTPFGTARDVGTQFEVRLIGDTLRLRVRTGIVELTDRGRAISGRAGTEITLSRAEAASRPIAPHDAEWEWASRLGPAASMEGESLAAYLRHLAREQGWAVAYADPALAREAEAIVLHGAVDSLSVRDRVEVAVAASGLRHRVDGGTLLVFRAGSGGPAEGAPR
jgi:hypothetical protein